MSYIQWLRGKIGRRKTILTFSSVVLRDDAGRILLQRRTDFDIWGLPGGILEPGESILDCARRELAEETGLNAGELRLLGIYTDPKYDSTYPNGDQVQQFTVAFQGQLQGGMVAVDGVETSALEFFEPDRLPLAEMPDFYVAMLQAALSPAGAQGGGTPAFEPPFSRPDPLDQIQTIRPCIGHALYIGAGSIGVVTDETGSILLGLRSDDGQWSLPGGFTHLGENAAYTVVREIYEETGLEVVPERLMGLYAPSQAWVYPNGDQVQTMAAIFRCRLVGGAPKPDRTETVQVGWFTPAELLALQAHPLEAPLNQAVVEHLEAGVFVMGGEEHR